MKHDNTLKEATINKDQPTEEEAKEAVKTLIAWAGDNPNREGRPVPKEKSGSGFNKQIAILAMRTKTDKAGTNRLILRS